MSAVVEEEFLFPTIFKISKFQYPMVPLPNMKAVHSITNTDKIEKRKNDENTKMIHGKKPRKFLLTISWLSS